MTDSPGPARADVDPYAAEDRPSTSATSSPVTPISTEPPAGGSPPAGPSPVVDGATPPSNRDRLQIEDTRYLRFGRSWGSPCGEFEQRPGDTAGDVTSAVADDPTSPPAVPADSGPAVRTAAFSAPGVVAAPQITTLRAPSAPPAGVRQTDADAASPAATVATRPEPHVTGPFVSALRHPWLALLPVWLLLVPSVAAILAGAATYGATSQILVGRVDVESTAVPGFVAANQQLAGVYARLVETEVIAEPVARELGLDAAEVLGDVSASPVPESSIILIESEAPDQETAVLLAATVAERLVAYVERTSVAPVGGEAALDQFRAASELLLRSQQARDTARAALAAAVPTAAAEARAAFVRAEAAVSTAQLQVETLSDTVRSELRGSGERNSLQVISSAVGTGGSDRRSRLQLAVAVSIILGAVLGAGLAAVVENRDNLRGLRQRDSHPSEDAAGPGR